MKFTIDTIAKLVTLEGEISFAELEEIKGFLGKDFAAYKLCAPTQLVPVKETEYTPSPWTIYPWNPYPVTFGSTSLETVITNTCGMLGLEYDNKNLN